MLNPVMTKERDKLAVFFLCVIVVVAARQVCIDERTGDNVPYCIDQANQNCCQSLEYAVNLLKSRKLCSNNHISLMGDAAVSGVVMVINFTNLTIDSENKYLIKCNSTQEDSGLFFEEVRDLTLRNIAIQGCRMITKSTTSEPHNSSILLDTLSAVYILKSSTVSLLNVDITFNLGTGVVMYDTGGSVEISDSIFDSNQVSASSDYSGGGGLYIEFTCSLLTIKYSHSPVPMR